MKYIFIFATIFALLNCKFENNEEITIEVIEEGHFYIGREEGKFGLAAKTNDQNDFFNAADIEENTHFNMNMTRKDHTDIYPLDCRLWKDEQKELFVFCEIKTEVIGEVECSIVNTINFEYKTKNVSIKFDVEYFELHEVEGKLPFLYSSSREIQIKENQKVYNLEFKIDSYNEEPLFISVDKLFVHLEKCKKGEQNVLKCELLKDNLDIISKKENSYYVYFIAENFGYYYFPFVKPIKIIYPYTKKENIYFSLVNITNNQIEIGSYITFETNVTSMNMEKIKTADFDLSLDETKTPTCHFIKHNKTTPLYMSCEWGYTRDYTIEQIEGFNQNDLHFKYNFILGTQNFTETIHMIEPYNSGITYVYPETLNFIDKNSSEIFIKTDLDNITLNEEGNDLQCENGNNYRKCIVTKSHFKNEENGYYLFHHRNRVNEEKNFTNYEAFGLNVIFERDDEPKSSDDSEFRKISFSLLVLISVFALF